MHGALHAKSLQALDWTLQVICTVWFHPCVYICSSNQQLPVWSMQTFSIIYSISRHHPPMLTQNLILFKLSVCIISVKMAIMQCKIVFLRLGNIPLWCHCLGIPSQGKNGCPVLVHLASLNKPHLQICADWQERHLQMCHSLPPPGMDASKAKQPLWRNTWRCRSSLHHSPVIINESSGSLIQTFAML